MFFSPELLSRRDSGFGLLWLAATLGAKSSLKKLNKRSVMAADITELCDLISQPSEPLALRLSSNLMVGVVRVYKVKQEIFMSDVQLCFNSLKKAVRDFNSISSGNPTQLQMAPTHARADVLTLSADPDASFAVEFDPFLLEWDEGFPARDKQEDDGEYNPQERKGKRKTARHARSVSETEQGRGHPHTLPPDPDYLLSDSFNMSFEGPGGLEPSSSQLGADHGFGLDDGLFGSADDPGFNGAMNDLARELGWDTGLPNDDMAVDTGLREPNMYFDEPPSGMVAPEPAFPRDPSPQVLSTNGLEDGLLLRRSSPDLDIDPSENTDQRVEEPMQKKVKKTHLIVDLRTELTDDELKTARAHYLEGQASLRQEFARKKAEKTNTEIIEGMLWGLPEAVLSPSLAGFWKSQLKARRDFKGHIKHPYNDGSRGNKRKSPDSRTGMGAREILQRQQSIVLGDRDAELDLALYSPEALALEDVEHARRASRQSSIFGSGRSHLGPQARDSVDWGALDVSSSVGGNMGFLLPGEGSNSMAVENVDVGIHFRSPNHSHPSSVAGRSQRSSSVVGNLGNILSTQMLAEDFGFALPGTQEIDSQQSDVDLAAIERNSLNYAKMQLRNLPNAGSLLFNEIAPPAICTSHVAASVFYHTLVLVTKDLVRVVQDSPHGPITIVQKHEAHMAAI